MLRAVNFRQSLLKRACTVEMHSATESQLCLLLQLASKQLL